MTYPALPFALVSFLADATPERAGLEKGPNHVTTVVQGGVDVRASRFAVTEDAHYSEVVETTIANYSAMDDVDTVALIFPLTSGEPMDMGLLLEGGRPATTFRWTYAPRFAIHLPPPEQALRMAKDAVGAATIQAMLDRDARRRAAAAPVVNPRYAGFAAGNRP